MESLEIMNETFEHSTIPLFWCTDYSFIILNTTFISLTGYTKDELLNKGFDDIQLNHNSQKKLSEIFETEAREVKIFTWVFIHANGSPVSVELRLTQFSAGANTKYYFGLIRDLSTSVSKPQLFAEDYERLQLVLQASKQGLWEWNVMGNQTFYSKEYFTILDYENDDFEPNYNTWAKMLHPDDYLGAVAVWDDFVATGKTNYYDEFRLRKKDGTYLWVLTEGRVLSWDKNGIPLRVIGIIKNINTKKLDELKIQMQTQKLIDYAFFNSHRLRAPLSSIMGLTELLKHEYNSEIVASLEKVSHQLDTVVHEINQILVGDSFDYKLGQQNPVKKISLVDNDKVLHVVYKKTIERYTNNIEITAYERAKNILELLNNKTLNTDLILLDIDSAFDIWGFLAEFEKTSSHIPIYLLAKNMEFSDTIRASQYKSIKGIMLKPIAQQAFVNFIKQINN